MAHDEKDFYNTLSDLNKLPKLSEETDGDVDVIPPIPACYEKQLSLKRSGDKLGIFLDLSDNGHHGSRIKKMSRGIAKTDGTLREGDYISNICGISLRVEDKVQLDYALKKISESPLDYKYFFKAWLCFLNKFIPIKYIVHNCRRHQSV